MTKSEACALVKGDYVRFEGSEVLLQVVQPSRPKYVLLRAPDGAMEVPHVDWMQQYTKVVPVIASGVMTPVTSDEEVGGES